MTGRRTTLIYALALAVAVLLQFDKLETWLSARFPDGPPQSLAVAMNAVEVVHSASGLAGLALAMDCSTAPMFDGTYKKTYRCQDSTLVDSTPPLPREESVQEAQSSPVSGSEAKITPEKLAPPANVLVVGDSLAITLAVSLDKAFRGFEGLTMIPKGKIASGLQNPQYFNWEQALRQFIKEYDPKLVIVMMGANDAKYLSLDPEQPEPAALADKRRAVYEARLEKFLAVMDERGVRSYWIGLPVMGDPELSGKSRALNSLVRTACQGSAHGRFLDTWPLLCDQQGNYAQHILDTAGHRVRVREGDKIHFSTAGGDIIVKALLKDAGEVIELRPKGSTDVAEAPTQNRMNAQ
ncbi:MAG: DUF459 domain-containing protein [Desulfovibrio sp.]|nr:DUF459 domain-containing protein [Desulfovibrio sp.]MBI4958150.1 DUF459 domain-containing protein [Desulfovibrio sp.]